MSADAANGSSASFPEVQGGGSLILAWQVRAKHVVVIGGGEVAASRILSVLNADARVTVVAPPDQLHPEVRHRITQKAVTWIPRAFSPQDLEPDEATEPAAAAPALEPGQRSSTGSASGATHNVLPPSAHPAQPIDMVLAAIDDPATSTAIWQACRRRRIPVNVADVPAECDFYFGSVHRQGPLQIMVSTNGNGPRLAALLRRRIAGALPAEAGNAIAKVGLLRKRLRRVRPGMEPEDVKARMGWMSKLCEQWSLEELCEIGEREVEGLLEGFQHGVVPSLQEIRGQRADEEWAVGFDGAFGWW